MVMKILNKKNSICLVLLSGCFLVGCSDNSEKAHLDSQEEELTEDSQITIGNFEQEQLNSLEVPDVSFEENPSYIAPNVSFEQDEYDEIPLISFEGEVSSDDKADKYNDVLNGYRESIGSGKK